MAGHGRRQHPRATRRFQEAEGGLEVTGELDDRTREALLARAGNGRFVVTGKVTDSAGNPFADGTVQALDVNVDTGARKSLGQAQPGENGSYTIEYTVKQMRELGKLRADLVVMAYDGGGAQRAQAGPIQRAPMHASVDLVIEPAPVPPAADWLVRGQVMDASGPLNGIQVRVFDRDLFSLRDEVHPGQPLGGGPTQNRPPGNEDGWFEFSYATSDFGSGDALRDGAATPDIIFALSRDGQPLEKFQIFRLPDGKEVTEETQVSADDLILGIQARKVEEVRIVIEGGEAEREVLEYERLIQAINRCSRARSGRCRCGPDRSPGGRGGAALR